MTENFTSLDIDNDLLKGVYSYGFKNPSKIQVKGIKSINTRKDCIIQSQSGTGKTGTFLLGILNKIDTKNGIQGLIILPTRELAKQVYEVASELTKHSKINLINCIGGSTNYSFTGHIVIGTIGRIYHMIEDKKFKISAIKRLVIDEADNLLMEKNLDEKLLNILQKLNKNTQKILISATLNKCIFDISNKYFNDPIKILLEKEDIPINLIKQYYIDVEIENNKFDTLVDLFNCFSANQSIIFCNTIRKVNYIKDKLIELNFSITYIHGQMTQEERNEAVDLFRNSKTRILLTTDLLARGIDIPQVNLVVNYDLPIHKETYIHRIGRCGRFGKKGVSISMVKMNDSYEVRVLNRMKNYYNIDINELPEDIETYI